VRPVIWDALNISDRAYHRRRSLIAIFVTILFAGLLSLRSAEAIERGWRVSDLLIIGPGLVAILYFGWMALVEIRQMRKANNG
jgi:hypothetical protein